DSWDTGEGAHDDGAGVVQSIEVLRTIKALDIKPKRTIRAVAFMNEENGLRGGKKYAELAETNNEKHIAALESDAGGFAPLGFGLNMTEEKKKKIQEWKPLFIPYNVWNFEGEGDGADISPLTRKGLPGIGLHVESQRYFEIHHAATDVIENVNKRELHLGAAAFTSLIYLLSEFGL
ncbi:MAG: M20/M25/M40 family metallo-hydrolase, partial [Bacteroidia bacterium]|nr:M20/M25/M40 family metallo-hydrolase [Bacteroidia bacterium]